MAIVYTLILLCITYAVLGNAFVLLALMRRNVPLNFMWAGIPGYLYRRCIGADVGTALTQFALSTNVALVVAFLCSPVLMLGPR